MKTNTDMRVPSLLIAGGCRALVVVTLGLSMVKSLQAQHQLTPEVIANAGGFSVGGGLSLSWTLGQVITPTVGTNGLILTQGFHQPTLSFAPITTRVPNDPDRAGELGRVVVAPHPVHTSTVISWERGSLTALELYDLNGTLLFTQEVESTTGTGQRHTLDMSRLPSATYLLRMRGLSGGIYEMAIIKVD